MEMQPIDLRELYGDRFVIRRDESGGPRTRDPWNWQIPHKWGHFYPYSDVEIGAALYYRNRTSGAGILIRLPWVVVDQRDCEGCNCHFPAEHFLQAAELLKAKRRRRLSEKERLRTAEHWRRYHSKTKPESTAPGLERDWIDW